MEFTREETISAIISHCKNDGNRPSFSRKNKIDWVRIGRGTISVIEFELEIIGNRRIYIDLKKERIPIYMLKYVKNLELANVKLDYNTFVKYKNKLGFELDTCIYTDSFSVFVEYAEDYKVEFKTTNPINMKDVIGARKELSKRCNIRNSLIFRDVVLERNDNQVYLEFLKFLVNRCTFNKLETNHLPDDMLHTINARNFAYTGKYDFSYLFGNNNITQLKASLSKMTDYDALCLEENNSLVGFENLTEDEDILDNNYLDITIAINSVIERNYRSNA